MINKPPPFKGRNIWIPIITPTKGRGFVDQGSGIGIVQLECGSGSGLRLTQGVSGLRFRASGCGVSLLAGGPFA